VQPVNGQPVVAVVMGSSSDLDVMTRAEVVLQRFGVAYELHVVSAHRTPEAMIEYGRQARSRGLKVIIAGAGGAAHLAGMLAAVSTLPVIGVPVALAHLDGLDSLLSMAQMPSGVPVATVAINGAGNAALLALRILSVGDDELANALEDYRLELASQASEQDRNLAKRT
jgi:5-(carboxyamino)imidazole ribonucleotide mutase